MPKSFVHGKVKPPLGYLKDYNLKAQHTCQTVVHTCPAFAGNNNNNNLPIYIERIYIF